MAAGRVLLATHRFGTAVGGTELYTLRLAQGLRARGWQVAVAAYAPGSTDQAVVHAAEHEGLPYYAISFGLAAADPVREEYHNVRAAAGLRQVLEAVRPDLLHVTHFGYLTTAVLDAARDVGVPVVATLTDFWAICPNAQLLRSDGTLCAGPTDLPECLRCLTSMGPRGGRLGPLLRAAPKAALRGAFRLARVAPATPLRPMRWLRSLAARAGEVRARLLTAHALACPGAFLGEILAKNGYPAGTVDVAPHGIAAPERLRRTTPLAAGPALRVGYIGPLRAHKGAHLPMEALERLGPAAPLRLTYHGALEPAGPGYAGEVLRRLAALPGATHAGPFPYSAIGAVLEDLDVLVVPSLWYENTPTIIYEAFAAGVPVIASDLGGMRELVQRYGGGWLFPRGDAEALAALLEALAADRQAVRDRAAEIRPVPALADHVTYWLDVYQRLVPRFPHR